MAPRSGHISNSILRAVDQSMMVAAVGVSILWNYAPEGGLQSAAFAAEFLSARVKVSNIALGTLVLIFWHLSFSVQGLYRSHRLISVREEFTEVARAVVVSTAALLFIGQLGHWQTINARTAVCTVLLGVVLTGGARALLRLNLRLIRRRGHNCKSLLIIGGGMRAQSFAATLAGKGELGYKLIGYLDTHAGFCSRELPGEVPWIGAPADLGKILEAHVIDEVAIALPIKSYYEQIREMIYLLEEQGIVVHLLSDFFPRRLAQSRPTDLDGTQLISLYSAPSASWQTEIKRFLDVCVSLCLLIGLIPVLIAVAIAIKLDSEGPVLFVQERMGYNKRRFRMLKFRTMVSNASALMKDLEALNEKDGPIFKIRNDPRITRVGKLLRRTSLDELPQLINVLLGDMSIVGPRPLSMRDAMGLSELWQKRRFSVRPGLTCLWQVSGRSNLSFDEWMQLDLEYIDHWSLGLDFQIMMRTIPAVLTAEGAV